jgi:hypothetical protein
MTIYNGYEIPTMPANPEGLPYVVLTIGYAEESTDRRSYQAIFSSNKLHAQKSGSSWAVVNLNDESVSYKVYYIRPGYGETSWRSGASGSAASGKSAYHGAFYSAGPVWSNYDLYTAVYNKSASKYEAVSPPQLYLAATLPGADEVTGVTIAPAEVSLARGESVQFVATVEGTGRFDPSVEYLLLGGGFGTSTTHDGNGLVTIGDDEYYDSMHIIARSVQDPEVHTSAVITVTDPVPEPEDPDDPGGGGGDEDADLAPTYQRTGGVWVKKTACRRQNSEWVLISTANE